MHIIYIEQSGQTSYSWNSLSSEFFVFDKSPEIAMVKKHDDCNIDIFILIIY